MIILKIGHYLDRYLMDKSYSITFKNNKVHIMNYIELEDFSNTKVIIKHHQGKTTIVGTDLVVSKMIDDELLIIGKIQTIEV